MNTHFPPSPDRWSNIFGNQLFSQLTRYFSQLVAKDEETPRVILRSPSGKNYDLTVSDAGALVVTPTVKTRA
jgi:hypothetical protein